MTILTSKSLNSSCMYALPEELKAIRELSDSVDSGSTMVMIGAGPAVFALSMMEGRINPPYLHIVDIDTVQWARTHLEAGDCDTSKITYVRADSFWYGNHFPYRISLLLVDGDHTYQGVKRDIQAWLPNMEPAGKIFFHDYLERPEGFNGAQPWKKGGCAQAVDEEKHLRIDREVGISVICSLSGE